MDEQVRPLKESKYACAAAGTHPTDVRMTTRFKEHDLTEGLTGAIHETGHSLYEQVPRNHQPVLFLSFLLGRISLSAPVPYPPPSAHPLPPST